AENRINLEVKDIMTRNFLTINSDEVIFEAIKVLAKTGSNQLVVSENGELWGIITPADIVRSLTPV
ncbi:MAG: CBS domain-containing protein, partial [Methanotrichaceae archaeon]|nr:CBS domain-containing protein [Methanotrichaceae archaeon]